MENMQSLDDTLSGDDKIKKKLEAEYIKINQHTQENYSIAVGPKLAKVLHVRFTNSSGANLEDHASANVTTGSASLGASYSKSRVSGHIISSPRVATYSI